MNYGTRQTRQQAAQQRAEPLTLSDYGTRAVVGSHFTRPALRAYARSQYEQRERFHMRADLAVIVVGIVGAVVMFAFGG